jgi:pantoate--beta-alanine ligase
VTRLFENLAEWNEERADWDAKRLTVGLVPTMGALHAGHRSLLEKAREENDRVVLTIFVNPTQFDNPDDLKKYPRTRNEDLVLADGLADAVVMPTPAEMYPDGFAYRVTENVLAKKWEGAHRPGHFEGVLTVVMKLLVIARPQRAYFGEKDWQQLELVRGLVRTFLLPVNIVACPTVREADGMALSSRNRRLSAEGRERAAAFHSVMRTSPDAKTAAEALRILGFEVDYVDDHESVRLGAVRLEGVRLIDNVRL